MGHSFIGIALLLLSLAAGMFLLAMIRKDNLGVFFKIISWTIIVLSLGALLCGAIRCITHCGGGKCSSQEKCMMMDKGSCGHSYGEMMHGKYHDMGMHAEGERMCSPEEMEICKARMRADSLKACCRMGRNKEEAVIEKDTVK